MALVVANIHFLISQIDLTSGLSRTFEMCLIWLKTQQAAVILMF